MKINNLTQTSKPIALAFALALSTTAMTSFAADAMQATETYDTSWMSPLAAEFAALDTSGNGLLLPYEASKGKAFNKKTFAQADTNHDGSIDLDEYINFKSGQSQNANQPHSNMDTQGQSTLSHQAPMVAESGTNSNRSVGEVIDDSVITAKAKAKILATKQLKSLQISVETHDGEVMLSGFVDNQAAKTKAEQVVSQIAGVKSVKNGLEVRG